MNVKRIIKRYLPHQRRYYEDRLFRRVNERRLAQTLTDLGVADGRTVYVQSSFGSLGYYPNGPARFIRLLQRLLGPQGTIVAPSFPFGGAMEDYVADDPIFDVRRTAASIGLFPEVLRSVETSVRSCHPTHPVVALGKDADAIIEGHEHCLTPQGDRSPFDKLVQADALVLRINTPAYPLCHRLQEIIDWPNLFIPDTVKLRCVNADGLEVNVETAVYRKRVPFVMYMPEQDTDRPIPCNLIDFPLLFRTREKVVAESETMSGALDPMCTARASAGDLCQFRSSVFNGCAFDSFSARDSMKWSVEHGRILIDRYRSSYDLAKIDEGLANGTIKI